LLEGDFDAIRNAVDILIDDNPAWEKFESGEVGQEGLTFDNDAELITGEEFADCIRFVYAITEGKYPGFKHFKGDPGDDLLKMGKKLNAFVWAPGDIMRFHNARYPGDDQWR
jgi:hypothetical protein